MEKIFNILEGSSPNHRYFNRYKKLIHSFKDYSGDGEIHHILPFSLYPEFKDTKTNLIKIPYKLHFILHFILYKMYENKNNLHEKKMVYAFSIMKRIYKKSLLYEKHRKKIPKIISKTNKGRKHYYNISTLKTKTTKDPNFKLPSNHKWGQPESIKRKIFYKFNILVYDKKENTTKFIKKDEFHKNAENYSNPRLGSSHSLETKLKMSENGIKGKNKINNGSESRFISKDEALPDGWEYGELSSRKKVQSIKISKLKHYYNPLTNESVRTKEKPKGFLEGRGNFNNKGSKGMKWYHLGDKEILTHTKPDGWYEGKIGTHYLIFNEKDKLVKEYSRKELETLGLWFLTSHSKDRRVGHNPKYISRLSAKAKEHIGWYSEKLNKNPI